MAFTTVESWSETAGDNTEIDGITLSNSTTPTQIDDIVRKVMAEVATWTGSDTLDSAVSTDLSTVPGQYVVITGTTTITAFGTVKEGWLKFVKFSGALTLTHNATSLILFGDNITTSAGDVAIFVSEGSGNWRCVVYQGAADPWASQPVGVPIPVFDHVAGVVIPPKDRAYRYVVLTAGEDGVGEYNEGIVTNESVSGTAPLVTATCDIDLTGSPFDGLNIRLFNTERRFIRADTTAGTTDNDAFQSHYHQFRRSNSSGGGEGTVSGRNDDAVDTPSNFVRLPITDGVNGTPRTANETRPKYIGATYYMRIL